MGKRRKPGDEKPGMKRRGNKHAITFNDKDRQEFLTGFHKRKVERRKAAVQEIKNKLREEQKRLREERHKEYLKMLKERKEALEDADELDDVITSTTESIQYNHPNHTVTVTTISDLNLSTSPLLHTNHAAEASDDEKDEGDEQEKVEALPRKAGNPLLSKKIQSLSASLHSFTKQKKKKRKGNGDIRGRSQQADRKSAVAVGNKHRLGKTTKKQRRKRTGRKDRSQY